MSARGPDSKAAMRQRLRAYRRNLAPEVHSRWSSQILSHVLGRSRWTQARTVASFIGVRGEVDLNGLLDTQGLRIVLPEVVGSGRPLVFREAGTLTPGVYGIPSPTGERVPLADIDLVLVPAVAVDPRGGRLGQGGGYYDRTFHELAAPRVAVIFEGQLVDEVPLNDHDLLVDAYVTETGWMDCARSG